MNYNPIILIDDDLDDYNVQGYFVKPGNFEELKNILNAIVFYWGYSNIQIHSNKGNKIACHLIPISARVGYSWLPRWLFKPGNHGLSAISSLHYVYFAKIQKLLTAISVSIY
jgi:hypothetical protein